MKINVKIINACCLNSTGGNPAIVVLNADALKPEERQLIVLKLGLSETAFFFSSKITYLKLDFFTPTKQIARCGHATIATFSYLKQAAKINKKIYQKKLSTVYEISF